MEPKAWDHTRIVLTHLFHQIPVFLQEKHALTRKVPPQAAKKKKKRTNRRKGVLVVVYLGNAINGKANNASVDCFGNQLGRLTQYSWVLKVTVCIEQFHHCLPLSLSLTSPPLLIVGPKIPGAQIGLYTAKTRTTKTNPKSESLWPSPLLVKFVSSFVFL